MGLQPPGQMFFRTYMFSEFGYGRYGGAWSAGARSLEPKLASINPNVEYAIGMLPWLECGGFASEASWWQSSSGETGAAFGHGLGDTSLYCKQRLLAPRRGGDTLWITNMFFIGLPTSQWAGPVGTPPVPGGFAPLGRLPATHLGEPTLTELVLFRKTYQPFRFSGGFYYSHSLPGSSGGVSQNFGDIFQYRFAFEHILDDKKGFAYAIEGIGLHGLPFRLDGRAVDAGDSSFGLIGVQPTLEYGFGEHVAAEAGVLFTAFGTNDVAAFYPNLSLYYYFNPGGRVAGR
ncbi:MAG: hypothetical protein HKL90_08920 [Elusimicrobia bacterium]|nr:hypothetical protein [Elusimicrobiota bacterium]